MTTGYVVNLENGHDGYCVESLAGVTYCGETFNPSEVDRERYAIYRRAPHRHDSLCFDCSKVNSHVLREAARGEIA